MKNVEHIKRKKNIQFKKRFVLPKMVFKGSGCEKWKGVKAKCDKKALLIASNLPSICCVYKEKIVKDVSYRIT